MGMVFVWDTLVLSLSALNQWAPVLTTDVLLSIPLLWDSGVAHSIRLHIPGGVLPLQPIEMPPLRADFL